MADQAEGSRHIIELGKFAGKLQKLILPKAGEPVPQAEEEEEPAVPTSTKMMYPYYQLDDENDLDHLHFYPDYTPNKLAVFLWRSKKDEEKAEEELLHDQLVYYYNSLNSVADELRGAYSYLPTDVDEFVQMMLVDGIFVLEVMRTLVHDDHDNHVIQRVLENDDDKKRYLRDILLLQNQLPIMLLLNLRTIQRGYNYVHINPNSIQEEWCGLVLDIARTFIPSNRLTLSDVITSSDYFDSALNILDVYRRCLVYHKLKEEKRGLIWKMFKPKNDGRRQKKLMKYNIFEYIPRATKLHEAGIRFKTNASGSLLDIQFSSKTLILPQIVVDSYTESLFLNLIAFENRHKHVAKNEITSYLFFMGCLVHGVEDVTLLQSHDIIISTLPSADVAAILREIVSRNISRVDTNLSSEIMSTVIMVRERYNKLSNEWRMELFQTYLKSPWAVISLFGALFLFILTLVQTVYSILS